MDPPGATDAIAVTPAGGGTVFQPSRGALDWPVLICLLGDFRLLKKGVPVAIRGGGKTETLLCHLALRRTHALPRDAILHMLWPDTKTALAGQSLNSLVYSLHKLLGDAIGGAAPVFYTESFYRLNVEAGVGVDVGCFDALAHAGGQQAREGNPAASVVYYGRAIRLYRGDLCAGTDVHAVVERERLRASYLTLLARLADHYYNEGEYGVCLDHALRLLVNDPCREDAHRLVMRCYTRRGERAQALRQFRLCKEILRREFGATPEPATKELFDRVRLDPGGV